MFPRTSVKAIRNCLASVSGALQSQTRLGGEKAPYVWSAKGFIYEEYYYLIDKKYSRDEYVWNDDILWKFTRGHKISVFVSFPHRNV